MDPPPAPAALADGWRRVDAERETLFRAGFVTVTADTATYEPDGDRDPAPDPEPDAPGRFFFVSRLRLTPRTAPNPALTGLVERRARAEFRDRLGDRGFGAVERAGRRRLAAGDREARVTRYRATCRVGGRDLPVEAYLAVRPGDDYLLSGGAYVRTDRAEERREELLGLIRAVGGAADGGDGCDGEVDG